MNLSKALRATRTDAIAFVGAGGKTTAMFQLARELIPPVLVTATTHLSAAQVSLSDKHIIAHTTADLVNLESGSEGVTLITGPIFGDKTEPVNSSVLNWLHEYCKRREVPLLIEADGSRGFPLKAPSDHEPPIPEFVDAVVQVAGLQGIGKTLTKETVHRPEIFARLGQLLTGEQITSEALKQVLLHAQGGLKNIPRSARRIALLNQADTPALQAIAGSLANHLLKGYDRVLVASLAQKEIYSVHEKIAGVVLAAGGSQRFGSSKQLLDWRGRPFVRAVAETALSAGLSPVIVVTGADAQNVEDAVKDLSIEIVRNEGWQEGQASSIRAGILCLTGGNRNLPDLGEVGAAVFLLVDQPQVTASILSALSEGHSRSQAAILAPLVMDQRANPVLFDRSTFLDLLELAGDVGGRALFSKYHVQYLPWHDDRLLLDVDTPEHYERLILDTSL